MRTSHRLLFLTSLTLSFACASPPLRVVQPVPVSALIPGAGQERLTDQVILVTDASGTMVASDLFPEAKALTQSMVMALPEGDVPSSRPKPYEAGSVGFGGNDRMTAALAPLDRGALAAAAAELRPLGSIDGRGGETPYRYVLPELGAALSGKTGRAAIVIVSDGRADQPAPAMAKAKEMVAGHPGEVCIHTVRMGDHTEGAAFLEELAALTSCGSATSSNALSSPNGMKRFMETVMLGAAPPHSAAGPTSSVAGPCASVIRLRGIEFAFDRYEVTPDSKVVLDVAAEQLNECVSLEVTVEGHTDFIGTDAYNQGLSERRAGAVRNYLISKGISGSRMQTVGFGESRPIAPGRTDDDRARNRRVELVPIR